MCNAKRDLYCHFITCAGWELTSGLDAGSLSHFNTSNMEAQQVTSGALPLLSPTGSEVIAALAAHVDPNELSDILHPRGSSPAADSTTVAAVNTGAATSEALSAAASVTTSIVNEPQESRVHRPPAMQQQ